MLCSMTSFRTPPRQPGICQQPPRRLQTPPAAPALRRPPSRSARRCSAASWTDWWSPLKAQPRPAAPSTQARRLYLPFSSHCGQRPAALRCGVCQRHSGVCGGTANPGTALVCAHSGLRGLPLLAHRNAIMVDDLGSGGVAADNNGRSEVGAGRRTALSRSALSEGASSWRMVQ